MRCPASDVLAAMAEDLLDPRERESVLDHAADCDDCRRTLLTLGSEMPAVSQARPPLRIVAAPRSWVPWAVAAALAISIVGLLVFAGQHAPKPSGVLEARKDPESAEPRTVELPALRQQEAPPKPPPPLDPEPRKELPPKEKEEPRPAPKDAPTPKAPEPPSTPDRPQPPSIDKPAPPPEPSKAPTVTVVATLDAVEGEVFHLGPKGKTRAKAGETILPGEGVECVGVRSAALVAFADKTRLELDRDTLIRDLVEHDGTHGRRLFVEKGFVKAEVSKQPAGLPMIFETAHGEAKVLGTTLALLVDLDPKKGLRLEVEEGKVELKNSAGKTQLVESGHQAVAAAGVSLAAKLLHREEVLLAIDFENGRKPGLVSTGVVERGPGGRICLAGDAEGGGTSKVMIGDGDNGLFNFQGDEVLSFDYWIDPQAAEVNLSFWDRTTKTNQVGVVPKMVVGKWARATLKLSDLGEAGSRMKEGDWIVNLYIQGTGGAPRRFFIDNVLITRSRVLKPRVFDLKK